ncbi:hypothetical protein UY3_07283 [Chelonia mydas]|uniref:Uncharacterized protein n=1 Tax=Chelonia mydas TaxID=8469 RepID=M7BTZ4_CHEMY|nr:hypothetical protein UY3_07283 [Chelonia mydas]
MSPAWVPRHWPETLGGMPTPGIPKLGSRLVQGKSLAGHEMLCLPERLQVRLLAAPTGRGSPFPDNQSYGKQHGLGRHFLQLPLAGERQTVATGSCERLYLQMLRVQTENGNLRAWKCWCKTTSGINSFFQNLDHIFQKVHKEQPLVIDPEKDLDSLEYGYLFQALEILKFGTSCLRFLKERDFEKNWLLERASPLWLPSPPPPGTPGLSYPDPE